jgi:hypothetical protein
MVRVSLSDQCVTRYYERVFLFRSMRDTLIRVHLPFWINERRATTGASPFSDQCETLYYRRVSHSRKRETGVLVACLALGPHGLKF